MFNCIHLVRNYDARVKVKIIMVLLVVGHAGGKLYKKTIKIKRKNQF